MIHWGPLDMVRPRTRESSVKTRTFHSLSVFSRERGDTGICKGVLSKANPRLHHVARTSCARSCTPRVLLL